MGLDLFFDPLFRIPLLVGLLVALLLPLLGALLRLQDEWLAALGLAHLAAASALAGLAVQVPAVLGGPIGAAAGAAIKALWGGRGNTAYAFMILAGWGTTLLIANNTALGSAMGHALVDGQLYFAGAVQLGSAAVLIALAALGLPWLMPRLIHARFFPRHEQANRLPAWHWRLGFDLLVALGMAVGTGTLGLMGAFALVLVPPWIAFRLARSWRWTLILSVGLGVVAYLLAFGVALGLDQPFGPILVAVLVGAGGLGAVARRARN
jgi:zinc transport system permease protein